MINDCRMYGVSFENGNRVLKSIYINKPQRPAQPPEMTADADLRVQLQGSAARAPWRYQHANKNDAP